MVLGQSIDQSKPHIMSSDSSLSYDPAILVIQLSGSD